MMGAYIWLGSLYDLPYDISFCLTYGINNIIWHVYLYLAALIYGINVMVWRIIWLAFITYGLV
jgi:hypothetical protein